MGEGPSIWCRNHSRRWANDSGSGSGRVIRLSAGRASPPPRRSSSASSATVGFSNRPRTGTSTPSAARILATSRVASSECPPRAKKLSSMPTSGTFSTWANRSHSAFSPASRGATYAVAARVSCPSSGAGSAPRSILPLGVSGSASRSTKADGTM